MNKLNGKLLAHLFDLNDRLDEEEKAEAMQELAPLRTTLLRINRLGCETLAVGSIAPIVAGATTREESLAALYDHALKLDRLLQLPTSSVRELAAGGKRGSGEHSEYPN